jgi:outer membrane receptor protein involved in Fe transport
MGALTAAGAAPALAQENLGEIVVTGSRIRSANLESTTPVTQVTAADVVTQGVTRIEDLVNQLPQAFAAQNVTVSNGATGSATLDLRGLGSPRTLVLIDGRRMPYGGVQPASAAPDINQIPTSMIERVDVLTGGASAVYGSDAVAGVVNFIMKKDFEGVQVTSQYNVYWHENDFKGPGAVKLRDTIAGLHETNPSQFSLPKDTITDGEGKELSLLVGVNSGDGRGNITAYATVFDSDKILQRDRDYSACSLNPQPVGSYVCGGSSVSAGGLFSDFVNYAFTVGTADEFRNFQATDLYNYGPLNYYQRPERRYSMGALGHYEFNEHADVYTQLMFSDYASDAQVAPSGNFFSTSSVRCDNPFLPAPQSRWPSGGATSRAAVACRPSPTSRSARSRACAARSTTPGDTTCRRSTRAPASTRARRTTSSCSACSGRWTSRPSTACRPAAPSSTAAIRCASPGTPSSREASRRLSSTTSRLTACRSGASARRSTTA